MSPTWPSMPTFMSRHPAPPASSVYSPQHPGNGVGDAEHGNGHFSSLRPLSNFFQRLTPRIGHRQHGVGDVEAGTRSHASLYDGTPANRHSATTQWPSDPFADPTATPPPLNVQRQEQQVRRPETTHAGGLPITFSEEEIAQPDAGAIVAANQPRQARRQHRRGGSNNSSNRTHRRKHRRNPYPAGYKPQSALQDPGVRAKVIHVAIAGLLFLTTLIVFLALQPTTPVFSAPFRVVNSLLIVFFAVVLLHAGIRLNTLLRAFRRKQRRIARKNAKADGLVFGSVDSRIGEVAGSGAGVGHNRAPYFDDPEIGLPPPGEPFRVILARDEELGLTDDVHGRRDGDPAHGANDEVLEDDHVVTGNAAAAAGRMMHEDIAGDDGSSSSSSGRSTASLKPKAPPPVYGVWRGSVRADPNLLHWQRVPVAPAATSTLDGASSDDDDRDDHPRTHGPQPPSYITDEDRRHDRRAGCADEVPAAGMQTLPSTRYLV